MYMLPLCPSGGTAVAFAESKTIHSGIFSTFLSAIFILAWMNLSNDVFDAETGVDENKVLWLT